MRKFLRLTLVCLMAMVGTSALADEKTILTNASSGDWQQITDGYEAIIDGFTISYVKHNSTNDTRTPDSDHIRVYKNAMLIIEGISDEVITGIEITCTGTSNCADMTVEDGTIAKASGTTITWTGSTKRFEAVATEAQVRIKSIVITYTKESADFVASPTISGETKFEGSTEVTITGAEGSTIYYTTDGTDPTTASTNGASPVTFTLNESATVKAIAVLNGNQSDVATREFTKVEFTDMTIDDLHKLSASQTNINLSINDGKVVYIDGSDVYVRDGENAMLFYRTDIPFTENATVSGTVKADFDIFRGLPEVKDNDFTNTSALTITDSEEEALPRNATIAEIVTDGKYMCDLVKISGIKITSEKYATDGTNQILLYGADDVIENYVGKDTECNLTAVVKKYNNAQLLPVSIEISSSISNVTVEEEFDENAPVYNLAGQRVSKDAKGIVIQNGKKYIRR